MYMVNFSIFYVIALLWETFNEFPAIDKQQYGCNHEPHITKEILELSFSSRYSIRLTGEFPINPSMPLQWRALLRCAFCHPPSQNVSMKCAHLTKFYGLLCHVYVFSLECFSRQFLHIHSH